MNRGWLGKYDLIAELPQEDPEDVFLSAAIAPGGYTKLAVIRVLRPELAADGALAARFVAAARTGALLNHANIAEVYEIGEARDGSETFVAMEYLEGQTLAQLIERVGANELGRGIWLRILVDVLAGLHHAHEALDETGAPLRLAHLRLTPRRVFVTYDGQVKLLDFGKLEASDSVARKTSFARRARLLAPEQARGEPADHRADIFAVGVMLWEASTRSPLWPGLDDRAIVAELAAGRIPSLRKTDPSVPEPLADIIGRALAPALEDRYSTAMHLQADLEGFLRASGDNPAQREIGRVVAHAFLEERLRTTTIVNEQLRRLRARTISTSLGEEPPLSLLRLEAAASVSPKHPGERLRDVPTSPRPFLPTGGAQNKGEREEESAPPSNRRTTAWIAGAAAVLVVLVVLALVRAR
ncbi:MAG: serine/threonine protein kinase [Polyangiaceae bacterium]